MFDANCSIDCPAHREPSPRSFHQGCIHHGGTGIRPARGTQQDRADARLSALSELSDTLPIFGSQD